MAIRVLLSIGECAQGSKRHSCLVCTYRWRIGKALSMEGCHVIKRQAWSMIIVGNVIGECHSPCTLNNFVWVDFAKE